MNKKLLGTSLLSFLAAIAGLVISFLLLKEDVYSTAMTIFDYFPKTYGVTPSASWNGAMILGLFISVLQIVSGSITFSEIKKFPWSLRGLAALAFAAALYFDNWTDIVFRSGYLTGDKAVATITTLAFYTFGSEATQVLSWAIIFATWRSAIAEFLWGWASFRAGVGSIGAEWKRFKTAAQNQENSKSGHYTPPSNTQTWRGFPPDSLMNKKKEEEKKVVSPIFTPNYRPSNKGKGQ